jgi:hypothetical protein
MMQNVQMELRGVRTSRSRIASRKSRGTSIITETEIAQNGHSTENIIITSLLVARVFGATFVLAGLFGFVPNSVVSPDGLFAVNAMHNLVHILTGVAFLAGAQIGYARKTTIGIGVYYVAVTLIGFLTRGDMLLGLIHINDADRWLHAGLAVAILSAGIIFKSSPRAAAH